MQKQQGGQEEQIQGGKGDRLLAEGLEIEADQRGNVSRLFSEARHC